MAQRTVQKLTTSQSTIKLALPIIVTEPGKNQMHDRLRELEVDYFLNVKYLQKVARNAYRYYERHSRQHILKEEADVIGTI